jgi:ferredoxin
MPRVHFVNEHRTIEAPPGARLADVAREAGIALNVTRVGRRGCGGLGLCSACMCWVAEREPGTAGPRTVAERLRGLRGERRLGCKVRVGGDLRVTTMAAASERAGRLRPVERPPSPASDPAAARKPDDAAPTALHIHGHPSAVAQAAPRAAAEPASQGSIQNEPSATNAPSAPNAPNAPSAPHET